MKKVLVFSHASILEVNRDLFYRMAELYDVDLRIACPEEWRGDLISNLRCQENRGNPRVPVIALPVSLSGNGSLFFYRTRLQDAFRDWQPELVFVDEEPWSLACAQIYRSFPSAELVFYTKQNLKKKVPFPFNLLQSRVFRRSSFCFSVSDETTDVLRWKGFGGDVRYLPHSFDPERFQPAGPEQRAQVRRDLGLRETSCVVGYFGRLEPEKGIGDLCAAIDLLERRCSADELEVLFVGNGSLADEVKAFLARDRKRNVVFRAALPHDVVGRTLAAIDVLALPSRTVKNWKEQFGRILVEAMACGVAVAGSDSGEIPVLIERSRAGLIFPERNPVSLADSLETLVKDRELLDRCKRNGREFARATLAHEHVARDLGLMLDLTASKPAAEISR